MSEEKNTDKGEQATDTGGGEPVSTQEDVTTSDGEGGETSEAEKAAEREKAKQGMLDKIPDWLKKEIQEEAVKDFDNMYSDRRDKELYDQNLPKVAKENNLSAEEVQEIEAQVENLRKYKDENGRSMSYEEALNLATSKLDKTTIQKAVKIVNGALPPQGGSAEVAFNTVDVSKFDSMTPSAQKEYMEKSKNKFGRIKFN